MITTSDQYVLEEGDKVLFDGLRMLCVPTIYEESETIAVELRVQTDAGNIVNHIHLSFTEAEIAAFTAAGSTDRDKFYNQVEQAVVDYLEGITENSGATFTIA